MIYEHYLYDLDYKDPSAYAVLLADSVRVGAYINAIDGIVKKDDVVAELGAGPGVFERHAREFCKSVILVEQEKTGIQISKLLRSYP